MPPKVLGDIFKAIHQEEDPNLLVGFGTADDAAVYRLNNGMALVQTVDFFAPIVDDPGDFGAISAANSLSDVYAMGGRPLTALSLVCFPYQDLPGEVLSQIVAGGTGKVVESGARVVGGHSVKDAEVKFGYAVTGLVDPDKFWRNDTPMVGDALVLTKPLGTGLITTAVKRDALPPASLKEPIEEMKRLNRQARDAAAAYEIHAATDITGFGLMGHLYEMVRGSKLGALVRGEALALFDGVWEAIQAKTFTGAHRTNKVYVEDYNLAATAAGDHYEKILFDPQTSGGLLFSLPRDQGADLLRDLQASGHRASVVGEILAQPELRCE